MAAGLPTEGPEAERPTAGEVARSDTPTCSLDEKLGEVRRRSGAETCVVVNSERIVLGILRAGELEGDPASRVEEAMRPGPSTYRPYVGIAEMAQEMIDHDLIDAPITTSDGRLIGLLKRRDAVAAFRRLEAQAD